MNKIETKYGIGDNVFYMANNRVQNDKISNIVAQVDSADQSTFYSINSDRTEGSCNRHPWDEKQLFETKEDLLKSL